MKYHLGLGSNLGRTKRNLDKAVSLLNSKGIEIRKMSSIYKTEPVGRSDQPWFINQAVEVESGLSPWELLKTLKGIEKDMGREVSVTYGSRLIDLDILLAEDTVIRTEELTIPHPRLAERNFVLRPLAEIAPDTIHPVLKRTIRELLRCSKDRAQVEMIR